ncbi:MAG: peptidase S9, partial [Planctomycetes bacterium]|nr:peptidase S9 [Planctomycetota bacterium]
RDERALPLVPPRAAGRRLARVERFRFAGANGDEVEALLWHPSDPERVAPNGRWPLIVAPHGGPYSNDVDRFSDRWSYAWHLLAERGAFVLAVNYHGSADYGRAFAESIKGRYYERELVDLVRAIEHVAANQPVDRDRLACIGWSNGAILSIALTSLLPDLVPAAKLSFKACVAGAGDVNWTSDYGNCRFGPSFDDYYLGGPPWRERAAYLAKSPLFHAERVTTPTLVLFGDQDTHVPTSQGWEWYRALQQIGKAPVKFVLFPGEPHGLARPSSRRRKLEEEVAFLDRHLFGRSDATLAAAATERDPVKEGSPFWSALQAESFARAGDAWGEPLAAPQPNWPVKGRTGALPEVVDVDGLRLGRFEVTRAQWQTFRPELAVAPGDENLPIAGVSLADAQAYVAWLTKLTGETWRLPYLDELEPLTQAAAALPGENTLDHWAGYAPRPDDAAALLARAEGDLFARIEGLSPLLREVGLGAPLVRGPPSSRVALYDLGGNVAEWALPRGEEAAKGARAVGGCALLASDPGTSRFEPPARAIGVRIVKPKRN